MSWTPSRRYVLWWAPLFCRPFRGFPFPRVIYGPEASPSHCEWIVPGTLDVDR